jgi:hypothetical protein
MKPILANWRTTAAGLIVVALGAAKTFLGIDVPGFSLDFIAALPVGVGLILAKDAVAPLVGDPIPEAGGVAGPIGSKTPRRW